MGYSLNQGLLKNISHYLCPPFIKMHTIQSILQFSLDRNCFDRLGRVQHECIPCNAEKTIGDVLRSLALSKFPLESFPKINISDIGIVLADIADCLTTFTEKPVPPITEIFTNAKGRDTIDLLCNGTEFFQNPCVIVGEFIQILGPGLSMNPFDKWKRR